jgi:hypothetical protein
MSKIKYKCKDCSTDFDGNDFTDECSSCGSNSIEPIGSRSGNFAVWIQEHKKPLVIVCGILILFYILINLNTCGGNEENKFEWGITQTPQMPYLEIQMFSISADGKKIRIPLEKIKGILGGSVLVDKQSYDIKDQNRIYLCNNSVGSVLIAARDLPNLKELKPKACQFDLKDIAESPDADCPVQLIESNIKVDYPDCDLVVTINQDLKGKNVFISISGKNGIYEKKSRWSRKGIKKTDVYVYIDGEDPSNAKAYLSNGESPPEAGCIPVDNSKIISDCVDAANLFGKDPKNRTSQSAFQSFVNKHATNPDIYLNDIKVDGLSDLQNKMRIMAITDGKKFKIQGEPKVSSNGFILELRFIYQ